METYCVRVSTGDLTFSAAHFITLGPDRCEGIHGHNYRVMVEVHGPLDDEGCVVDFVLLQRTLREILAELDHRVLLPLEHKAIRVDAGPAEVEVRYADRRWVFPASECCLLPLSNTTAELLARHIGRRLLQTVPSPLVRVEIEESAGFSAVCEWKGE